MNSQKAKEILSSFRSHDADGMDPYFAEALKLSEQDQELKQWFDQHLAIDHAIRAKLKNVEIPNDLREKILNSRQQSKVIHWKQPLLMAASILFIVIVALFYRYKATDHFDKFQIHFAALAEIGIEKTLNTENLDEIREFLRSEGFGAFNIPVNLAQVPLEGGALGTWKGEKIPILCFETIDEKYIYVFLANKKYFPSSSLTAIPEIHQHGNIATAAWAEGDIVALVTVPGNEELIHQLLH